MNTKKFLFNDIVNVFAVYGVNSYFFKLLIYVFFHSWISGRTSRRFPKQICVICIICESLKLN